MLGRTAQAIVPEDELRVNVYVDDPAFAVLAPSEGAARHKVSIVLWWWAALGLRLSWAKGAFGQRVRWIGVVSTVGCANNKLVHTLPEDFLDKIERDMSEVRTRPWAPAPAVKRLAARLTWGGGVAEVLGSLAASLWAACAAAEAEARKQGQAQRKDQEVRVPRRRYEHILEWIDALKKAKADKVMAKHVYLDDRVWDAAWTIVTDASPWGGGAFLSGPDGLSQYLAVAWDEHDGEELGIVIGSNRQQATVEALSILVAVRAWRHVWSTRPTALKVKSDSMSAIGAVQKMRSGNSALNRIVRELAIEKAYAPHGLTFRLRHLKGDHNEWADALSRLAQPGSGAVVPGPLRCLRQPALEARGPAWWQASTKAELQGERAESPEAQEVPGA